MPACLLQLRCKAANQKPSKRLQTPQHDNATQQPADNKQARTLMQLDKQYTAVQPC
jgi:hypothetical protein